MAIHDPNCDCKAYGCVKRREGFGYVSGAATPTRTQRRPFRPGPRFNSWEAGLAGEHRADGSFMPYLDANGARMGIKEYSENRRAVDEARSRQRSGVGVDA